MQWLQLLVGQGSQSRALVPWGGESVDPDRFWAEAWRDLQRGQRKLARDLKLAGAHWHVDQDAGLIQFERADGALLAAPVQIVAAWNPHTHAFTWAWDHPSVQTRLRADAERTRWFGEKHGLCELTQPVVTLSEQEAWRMSAVAMKVNGAAGVYRGPTEGPHVFMTMRDVRPLF